MIVSRIYTIILATSLFLSTCALRTRAQNVHPQARLCVISGQATYKGKPADSITVHLPLLSIHVGGSFDQDPIQKAICDRDGKFKMVISLKQSIQPSELAVYSGGLHYGLHNFYIEPGDNVFLTATWSDNIAEFSCIGLGTAKYNYANELQKIGSFQEFLKLKDLPKFRKEYGKYGMSNINASARLAKYYQKQRIAIFKCYRSKMSRQVKMVIEADLVAIRKGSMVEDVYHNYFKTQDKEAVLTYYKKMLWRKPDTSNSKIKILSKTYIDYLYSRSKLEASLKEKTATPSVQSFYKQIKEDYSGIIRDYVVASKMFRNSASDTQDRLAITKDALTYVKQPEILKGLKHMFYYLSNDIAYNFKLSDEHGNLISLTDFKGKIVLIDVWFTGCVPCKILAKTLKSEVMPAVKNKAVEFISINVDKSKEQWLNSMRSGEYTDVTGINLFSEGRAFADPFIRYYQINSCPTLLLVDRQGKLVTRNLSSKGSEIIAEIENIL